MGSFRCYQKIKILIRFMHRRILLPSQRIQTYHKIEFEEIKGKAIVVPQDVKEGHFAVFAVKCEKPERFVVELRHLSNPAFLMLLEQAEEEYGFQQEGAITVPCSPEDFQKIVQFRR